MQILVTKRQLVSSMIVVMDKKILSTPRLYLREIDPEDLDFLVDLHSDPEVMKYIGPLRNAKQVERRLKRIRSGYKATPGFGIWLACKDSNTQPIGWACLKDLDQTREIEVGYRLAKQFWGKGYATELTVGLLNYGFNEIGLQQIVAVARPDNTASIRVLSKAGIVFEKMSYYYKSKVVYYRITKSEYEAASRIKK